MTTQTPPIKLKDVSLFQGLSKDELNTLKACLKEKTYDKGEILFLEGKQCERVFIVQSGRIKIFRVASSGREQILEVLGPGDSCACNPGAAEWCCTASAQALATSRVWFLYRDHYIRLVKDSSNLSHTLNRLFAQRLCRFSSLIEEVSLNDAQKRLIKFILDMLNEDIIKDKKDDALYVSFTREEIAQRIGTARETVARHLHQLKQKRLIDIKPHQIIIRDRDGLEKFLLQ